MTLATLEVRDARLEFEATTATLSGEIAGERLFWTMPIRASLALRGEPFVAALLVSAMRSGRDLVLPDTTPIDAEFLERVAELQSIFARWFPGLTRIAIHAPVVRPRGGVAGRLAGYSGGIDASFTVMSLRRMIDGVVFMDGIEFRDPRPDLISEIVETLRGTMAARGLPLTVVQTNVKRIGLATGGRWPEFIGGALASIPHALGVSEYVIAASNSWENLRPYGTHPITDPHWSSASTRIRHHGTAADRFDKLAAVCDEPDLLAVLRVCFQGARYNCGHCQKCLQTAAALRALEITAPSMPHLEDPQLLRSVVVEHHGDLVEWLEILTPELPSRDPELAKELGRLIRRYRVRHLLKEADTVLFSGGVKSLFSRFGARRPRQSQKPVPSDP